MRFFPLCVLFASFFALQASAFQIPPGTYNLAELEKAQTAATKKSRPLVFIISVKDMKET